MDNLTDEIRVAIEKSLPKQTGDVLRKRLEEADAFEIKVKQQEEALVHANSKIKELSALLEDYKKLDGRNFELEKREAAVFEGERNRKVFEAELRASAAEARANEMFGLVGMVFKSPVFRKTINESDFINTFYSNGQEQRFKQGSAKTEEIITE